MADEPARLDPQALARLARLGGAEFAARMVELFLVNSAERLERAGRAAAAGDAVGVERASHSLKSMAANVGALRLCALAESLERDAAAGVTADLAARVSELDEEMHAVRAALAERKGDGT